MPVSVQDQQHILTLLKPAFNCANADGLNFDLYIDGVLHNDILGQYIIRGVKVYNISCISQPNSNYTITNTEIQYTINKNNTLVLNISGTTPITYPAVTNVIGGGCPAELVCNLDKVNKTYGVSQSPVTFNYSTNGNANYSSASITKAITINQNNTFTLTATSSNGTSFTYPIYTTLTGTGCPTGLCNLYNGNTIIGNPSTYLFGVGTYNIKYNQSDTENYSNSQSSVVTITVSQNTTSTTLITSPATPQNYGVLTNFTCSNTYGTSVMTINTVDKSSEKGLNLNRSAGVYNINCSYTGNANYSSSSDTGIYTINQIASGLTLWLDNAQANKTITQGQIIYVNATRTTGQINISLYKDGSLINQGINIFNLTNYSTIGYYKFNATIINSTNYTGIEKILWLNVTAEACIENITNSSWGAWSSVACVGYDLNVSRNRTQYDSSICGLTPNVTFYQYSLNMSNLLNTNKTDWTNLGCSANQMNQSRNWTEYDNNNLGCFSNLTFKEYQSVNNFTNTSVSAYTNLTCIGGYMNQSRYFTEYDTYTCGLNTTYYEYRHTAYCEVGVSFLNCRNFSRTVNLSFSNSITATNATSYSLNDTSIFNVNSGTGLITNITGLTSITKYNLNLTASNTNNGRAECLFYIDITAVAPSSNVTGTTASICNYKCFGVYNLKLPWFREENCI